MKNLTFGGLMALFWGVWWLQKLAHLEKMFPNIIGGCFYQNIFVCYLFEVTIHYTLSPVEYIPNVSRALVTHRQSSLVLSLIIIHHVVLYCNQIPRNAFAQYLHPSIFVFAYLLKEFFVTKMARLNCI